MPARSGSARGVLCLPDPTDGPEAALWAVFDPEWYRKRYPDAPDLPDEALLEWHLSTGQTLAWSPNRYFDEEWQRKDWAGISGLIEGASVSSAFDAWCRSPHSSRPPHWLFSPREYRLRYPALTDEALEAAGLINSYDHYLRFGAAEGRIAHPFFDPAIYLASLDRAEAGVAALMPFRHYLEGLEAGAPERRTSFLFDPDWYRARYPDAVQAVKNGQYRSLLGHYLCNDRPTEYDPFPRFSEEHYLRENPGLINAIGPTGFRNGFVHFLDYGVREGRAPHPELDLVWYAAREDVRADIDEKRAPDAFMHWVAIGYPAGFLGRPGGEVQVSTAQGTELHRRRANAIWPLHGRRKLDFTRHREPDISVIMTPRNRCAETLVSLASLRSQCRGEIDLILVATNSPPNGEDIEDYVAGATILRFGSMLNDAAAREAGLVCAAAETVLLLGDGIELAPGALDAGLARLAGDTTIGAVGGRLVQPHGVLMEAGGIIWRDGQLQPYARDASPLAAEANFVRDVDYCSGRFLLSRRDVLAALPDQADGLAGTTHDGADLCVRIQHAGYRVIYDPDVLAFMTIQPADRVRSGLAAFIAAHTEYLAGRPPFDPVAVTARSVDQGQPRILFIEDSIPLRRIGSGFVRSNDVLRAMGVSGAAVTLFPIQACPFPAPTIRAELPDTVEAMQDLTEADFANFIASRGDFYDIIWIARTHNLDHLRQVLASLTADAPARATAVGRAMLAQPIQPAAGSAAPASALFEEPGGLEAALSAAVADAAVPESSPARPRIVVDTEAIAAVRQSHLAALSDQVFNIEDALRTEFRHLDVGMDVVVVTESEADIVRGYHSGKIAVLGHAIACAPTPRPFEARNGILFVGAIHGMDHPNYDGLAWFVDEVLPLIERNLRWETRLTVAGYVAPGVSLDRFRSHPRITLRGALSDLTPLYDANRVFIAPTRFAAGIPYKVHEAAARGVPVVATSLLASQLGWRDAEAIGAADAADPAGFAARVIALYRDPILWTRIRDAALARVDAELDRDRFTAQVAALIQPRAAVVHDDRNDNTTVSAELA